MATLSNLKPGQVVYDIQRRKMGNTTITTTATFSVHIVDVHDTHVVASWNHNTPERFYRKAIGRWKVNKPWVVQWAHGYVTLANREEVKEARRIGNYTQHSDSFTIKKY